MGPKEYAKCLILRAAALYRLFVWIEILALNLDPWFKKKGVRKAAWQEIAV
jgi:hypothetical protein